MTNRLPLAVTLACLLPVAQAPNPLVGTWRFVEVSDWDSAGTLTQAYGPRPCGYIIYTATGQVSVHIASCSGPPAARLYAGYFGSYSVDATRGRVIHHVEGGDTPGYTGTDQERPFRIRGDSLILGDGRTWRRVLVRVREPGNPR